MLVIILLVPHTQNHNTTPNFKTTDLIYRQLLRVLVYFFLLVCLCVIHKSIKIVVYCILNNLFETGGSSSSLKLYDIFHCNLYHDQL